MTAQPTAGEAARRITVVGAGSRMDLSLPAQSPIAELVPQLVRLAGAHTGQPPGAAGWVLNRLGGPPLAGAWTVAGAGIHDGEVLYLSPSGAVPAPLVFDDVVDAIASAAEGRTGVWRAAVSRRVGAALAGLAFAAVAVLAAVAGLGWPGVPVAAGALAALLLVAGGAVARAYGDSMVGAVLVAAGLPAALVAGLESFGTVAVTRPGVASLGAASLGVGLACAAGYAVLGAIVVADHTAWFVPAAVAAGTGALAAAATAALDVRPAAAAGVLLVCVIALSPVLPSVALRLGRLPMPRVPTDVAAFRRDERPTPGPEVGRGTRIAGDALSGLLAAVAGTVLGAVAVLLRTDGRWAWGLAGDAGVVLLLRARAYLGVGQRAALLVGGVVALAGAGVRAAGSAGVAGWLTLLGALALAGVVCATYAVRAPEGSPSPYWSRLLDVVEIVAMVGLLPVAAAVLEVYAAVRSWGG
jgi:type VII secretion integral membrane protein EccD